jgi:D-lactate dehydrogenase (cytochrome)
MPVALFGHVGDGNFHLVILVDPANPGDILEAQVLNTRVVERALAMNGTCTGEHGIGFGKIGFLEAELGSAIPAMRAIKRALDPDNIMNPGKMIASAE